MGNSFSITGINSAYDFHWDDKFVFSGESHKAWEIVFVRSGKVVVTKEDKVYTLGGKQLVVHPPWEFHSIRSAPGSSPSVCVTSFYADGTLPEELKSGVFDLTGSEAGDFLYTMKKISAFAGNRITDGLEFEEAACRLKAFLIRISKRSSPAVSVDASPAATTYHRIASFMIKNVKSNYSVTEIAGKYYISLSYLKFLFRKYAGTSPKKYQEHLQIQYINYLLEKGESVARIAAEMNFSSPNYLSSFYKKQTGQSPKKTVGK